MALSQRSRTLLKRLVQVLLAVELVWLVVINGALALPLTQTLINTIRPEKFFISWDRAWSWYPGNVQVRGVFANGQSRSQQWQFETPEASGSVALLPLAIKRVHVRRARALDVDFRLRPRFKEGRDYSRFLPWYPDIEGWEMTDAVTTPRKKKRPWNIVVNNIAVEGEHELWMHQFRGTAQAGIRADMTYRSRGGPLSLDAREVDLQMERLTMMGEYEVFRDAALQGSMGFAPFKPREHKDITFANYLLLDMDLSLGIDSLRFLNVFLANFKAMTADGSGRVDGRLHFERGAVMEGTDLHIDADDLRLDIDVYRMAGSGDIRLEHGAETGGQMEMAFEYRDLEVTHRDDGAPMLTGENLLLTVGGDGHVMPKPEGPSEDRSIDLEISELAVPDLALFQRFLPQNWPFTFHGGTGSLRGRASLAPRALSVDFRIQSEDADMGIRQYRFDTSLDAVLKLENPSIMDGQTALDGTYFRLYDARFKKEGQRAPNAWYAAFEITEGRLGLLGDDVKRGSDNVIDLFQLFGRYEARELLADSSGAVTFESEVSSLAWIGVLFRDNYQASVSGSGRLGGVVTLDAGLPAPGTEVAVSSDALQVHILDFVATGDGGVDLAVEEGGDQPDWKVAVALRDAGMRRRDDEEASIHDVDLELEAVVENVSFEREPGAFALQFRIPSALVSDMAVFNGFLPPDSPVRFAGGQANLTADIELQQDDADGWLRLRSDGVKALADEQSLTGDLEVDVLLVGGRPADMVFDVSGSELRLNNVRVSGEQADFDQEAWSAVITLTRGGTTWKAPLQLDLEAELSMSDSRPIVALFENQDGLRPKFIGNMLTVEDIRGAAQLNMADERMRIPQAHAVSDNIDVGAKALIDGEQRNGVIYLRYKKLDALLKIRDGKKNLDIIKPLEKFEAYELPR